MAVVWKQLVLCGLALAGAALWMGGTPVAEAQTASVVVSVDAAANRRPINPLIYGVAHASQAALADLNAPLNRNGGNNTSRYNWQQNADNRGQDWYFQSIPESSAVAGERGDTFISSSRAASAEPMLTVPMVGWVAKLGPNRSKLCSFSQAKYGAQTDADWQWFPDAGNGILRSTGQPVAGNDPNDANVPADSSFQQGWVNHLVQRWGGAGSGGLRYYILDNEPSLWHSTHRDVHPTGARMEEVRDKILDYAAKIKAVDPGAVTVGPEEWGWSGYLFSGYDQQWGSKNGWANLPDRTAHGGMDYLPWLLDQLRQSHQATGQRLLDVFTVHYYPQGGEFSSDVSSAMQLRRNRSTRSLWDPNYVDETWINDRVRLIPRLKGWVSTYSPGTPVGITEYNWGAEGHINGATAQADIYGIFGREGLDMAARWTTPDPTTPTYKAMKMYRNYDGSKSAFGDTSVAAAVPNPDNVSAFAAVRSPDDALTVMAVNKQLSGSAPITVNVANYAGTGPVRAWQLTSANAITRPADVAYGGNSFSATLPAQSVTLFVLGGSSNPPPPPPPPPADPVFTSSATASPATVEVGKTTTLSTTVTCTAGSLSGGIVDLEVTNAAGTKVTQQFWSGQSFTTGQSRTYSYAWTAPAGTGTYTLKVGVFNADWSRNYHWNNSAGTVTVKAPAPPAFSSSAAASPSTVQVRKNTTISATVRCTAGSLSNGIVDVEVYNSAGTKVGQKYWPAQNFAAGQSRSYSYVWTAPATRGTYTVKIGVFGANWSPGYHWNNGAATVTVR
jgi:glycosyl hydrolase family 44